MTSTLTRIEAAKVEDQTDHSPLVSTYTWYEYIKYRILSIGYLGKMLS